MIHDYDLPPDWDSLSPEQKDEWFQQERARRQAMRQDTPFSRRVREARERRDRRAKARNETTEVRR